MAPCARNPFRIRASPYFFSTFMRIRKAPEIVPQCSRSVAGKLQFFFTSKAFLRTSTSVYARLHRSTFAATCQNRREDDQDLTSTFRHMINPEPSILHPMQFASAVIHGSFNTHDLGCSASMTTQGTFVQNNSRNAHFEFEPWQSPRSQRGV